MELEEGLEIIRREMRRQAEKNKKAAAKRAGKYQDSLMSTPLFEAIRVAITADALEALANVLTIEKIETWRLEQLKNKNI